MINLIYDRYCTDKLVQLMVPTGYDELLFNEDGPILIKRSMKDIYNAYPKNPNRLQFPYHEITKHTTDNAFLYNVIFEKDKTYIKYSQVDGKYKLYRMFVKTLNGKNYWFFEELDKHIRLDPKFDGKEITREELKEKFDHTKYDSTYIVETSGQFFIAADKNKGILYKKGNFLPRPFHWERKEGFLITKVGDEITVEKFCVRPLIAFSISENMKDGKHVDTRVGFNKEKYLYISQTIKVLPPSLEDIYDSLSKNPDPKPNKEPSIKITR